MLQKMSLRARLLVPGVLLTLVPLVLVAGAVWYGERQMKTETAAACRDLAFSDLDHIAEGVYALCATQHEVLLRQGRGPAARRGRRAVVSLEEQG
jgi:hypothetical protein